MPAPVKTTPRRVSRNIFASSVMPGSVAGRAVSFMQMLWKLCEIWHTLSSAPSKPRLDENGAFLMPYRFAP
jgi:hypothetical protein